MIAAKSSGGPRSINHETLELLVHGDRSLLVEARCGTHMGSLQGTKHSIRGVVYTGVQSGSGMGRAGKGDGYGENGG